MIQQIILDYQVIIARIWKIWDKAWTAKHTRSPRAQLENTENREDSEKHINGETLIDDSAEEECFLSYAEKQIQT